MGRDDNTGPPETRGVAGITNRLWGFFTSVKLALVLILLISAFSLLGAFAPGLDVFHSWWFVLAGSFLMLNILVCTLNRWETVTRRLGAGKLHHETDFFAEGAHHSEVRAAGISCPELLQIAKDVLRRHGYRVHGETDKDNAYLAADKYRYSRLGTFVTHLSLILFVLAYLIGGYLGFRETNFAVAEGASRDIGHGTGLSLRLLSFADEYYPDNTPKDYRSSVVLYDNGLEAQRAVVRVNHPLEYKGIRIYQSFFGPAAAMQISRSGTVLFSGNIPLDLVTVNQGLERQTGSMYLTGPALAVRITAPAMHAEDPLIPPGRLAIATGPLINQAPLIVAQKGTPIDIDGTEFTYRGEAKFSGFQVSSDPANAFIWIASSLFILGIALLFYFPHRQVWMLFYSEQPGKAGGFLRMDIARGYSSGSELTELAEGIDKELRIRKAETGLSI